MAAQLTGSERAPLGAVYAALIAQTLISAGTYLAAKQAMLELSPLELVCARFALSGSVFIALLALVPGRLLPPRGVRVRVLVLGVVAGPINQGFFFYGLASSSAAHAALLYALTPIGVYLCLLSKREVGFGRNRLFGIVVAFVGVVVLLTGRGLIAARGGLSGDLMILIGVAAWVVYTAEGRKLIAQHGAFHATAWTMAAAALISLPFSPLFVDVAHLKAASTVTWAMVLYLGIATSVVAYVLWYFALSRLEASRVAVFSNLQPVATAFAAWLILGEQLTWEIFAGGALVIAGVRIAQRVGGP